MEEQTISKNPLAEELAREKAKSSSLEIQLYRLQEKYNDKVEESDRLAHVIIESGVAPGIDYPCRCEECEAIARELEDVGYIRPTESERWWA